MLAKVLARGGSTRDFTVCLCLTVCSSACLRTVTPAASLAPERLRQAKTPPHAARTAAVLPLLDSEVPIEASLGPAGPVAVGPVANDGKWFVACAPEAADGHPAALYAGTSVAQPITAFGGSSADSRYLAVLQDDRWLLLDTRGNARVDLTAQGLGSSYSAETSRQDLKFHPTRPLLAYVAQHDQQQHLALRDLLSGVEQRIALPTQGLSQLEWDAQGRHLYLDTFPPRREALARVSNRATAPTALCALPHPELWVYSPRSRPLTRHVLSLDDFGIAPATGTVLVTPDGSYVLTEKRQVVLRRPGQEQPMSPPSCEAYVLAKYGPKPTMLVGCLKKGRMSLALVSAKRYLPLPIEIPAAFDLDDRVVTSRVLPIYSGSKSYIIDFEQTRSVELLERDQLLARTGDELLVRRGHLVLRRSLTTGNESPLEQAAAAGASIQVTDGYAYVSPYLIAAAPDEAPRNLPQGVLAITAKGCALVPREPADPPRYAQGPLRWLCRGSGSPSDEANAATKACTVENRASGSTESACSTQSSTDGRSSGR